jgi:TRAP-type transport system periplasmic protein
MELSEVFMALQTGVMDGQENPLAQIAGQRFQEVQNYLSMSGHVYTPAYITTGRAFDRLPGDVQEILIEVAARDAGLRL